MAQPINPRPNPAAAEAVTLGGTRFVSHPDITITTSKQLLRPRDLSRVILYVTNNDSTNNVRIGDFAISVSQGVRLKAASPTPMLITSREEIWAIAEAGTPVLSVTEELL